MLVTLGIVYPSSIDNCFDDGDPQRSDCDDLLLSLFLSHQTVRKIELEMIALTGSDFLVSVSSVELRSRLC